VAAVGRGGFGRGGLGERFGAGGEGSRIFVADGGDVSELGEEVCGVSAAAIAVCGGGAGCGGVFVDAGGEATGERVDAEAGVECVGVFPPRGVEAGGGRGAVQAGGGEAAGADGVVAGGVSAVVRGDGGIGAVDGGAGVWVGTAVDGTTAAAGASFGSGPAAGDRGGREGRSGSGDSVAGGVDRAVEEAGGAAAGIVRGGSEGGVAGGMAAGECGSEVSEGERELGVAVGVSVAGAERRSGERGEAASPSYGYEFSTNTKTRRGGGEDRQARDAACIEALVCDAFVGERRRYKDGAGSFGASECRDDADLYTCDGATGVGGAESDGSAERVKS